MNPMYHSKISKCNSYEEFWELLKFSNFFKMSNCPKQESTIQKDN